MTTATLTDANGGRVLTPEFVALLRHDARPEQQEPDGTDSPTVAPSPGQSASPDPVPPPPSADGGTAPDSAPAAPVAAPPGRLGRAAGALSRLRSPGGDTVIAWAMTGSAAAVILFAAIVSYSHIHGLATSHHEDSTQAHLLPLSIDGVIAEASLVLLFAARHKLDAPWLARAMLWTGIVATLVANAVVALPQSWISPVANAVIGAVLSA